ncbi:hypothetical protein Forpe1208_v017124 [Fusarium oxysporum f. sp. rapae]|uniref:Uncharacterized protein n=1 Tax=Fusarium oxysporum f. sp. rapae TaxID=485398 RepID=A0A8J5TNT0_FUSOX|nr:hypothetical protein Forpe1208_v017124 [Fusarium oxysporum f. sp. rapae]
MESGEIPDDAREDGVESMTATQDSTQVVQNSQDVKGYGEARAPSPEDMRKGMCDVLRRWESDSYLTGWHLGTEQFTSQGEFVCVQARGRAVEREVITFANRFDVNRDTWFFNALLTAALGHIYTWARQEPLRVREVLDPRVLNELRESLRSPTCVQGEWVGLTYYDMYQKISCTSVVAVEDVWKDCDNNRNRWKTVGQRWKNWQDQHSNE